MVRLTSHHGDHAGLVDVGEGAQLPDGQDGFHVGVSTGLPELTDLIVHGCGGRRETRGQCVNKSSPHHQHAVIQY